MAKRAVQPIPPFQLLVLAVLAAMILCALYLSSRGDPIPMSLSIGFAGTVGLVLFGIYQSMSSPPAEGKEVDVGYFDRKKDRKESKKIAKAQAKAAAEEAAAEAKAAADAAKAHAKKVKLAQEKARKAQEKEAQEKAERQKELALVEEKATAGKKKKKKKPTKPKAEVVADVEEEVVKEAQDWVVATDKFNERKKKKAEVSASTPSAVVDEGAATASITMEVDKKHYKVIIGAGSKNINALQNMFGCKIQLPNKNSSDETVTISGNPGNLAAVKEAITQLVEKGYCKALSGDVTDVSMTISNVGLLIGPGGKHVGTIRDKTGVEINLPPKDEKAKAAKSPKSGDTTITLVGELVGIQQAMNAINQLMLQGFCDLTHPDWVRITMGFPGSMLGVLLGPKGANLKDIEAKTETTIKVPNAKTDEDKARAVQITITGAISNVEKARAMIAAVQTDFVKKEMDFPTNLVNTLMGNKGESIRALQQTHNVRINVDEHVWDPDLRTLSVEGFTKDCTACVAAINEIVATHTRVKVEFPTSRIGFLIGKAGATIGKIKTDCSVRINVSDHEWDESVRVVSIDGLSENVAAAVAKVEALKVPPPKKEKKAGKDKEKKEQEQSEDDAAGTSE